MRLAHLKTPHFLCGFGCYFVSTLLAVICIETAMAYKSLILLFACVLYSATQVFTANQISLQNAKDETLMRLKCVDILRFLDVAQRLRSNVFRWDKKKEKAFIWVHHNMETDPAKNLAELRYGEGCTGAAWKDRCQKWGAENDIYGDGQYALGPDQEEKVSHDLKWICSTPIVNEKRQVIAVLNFDGNMPMEAPQQTSIKEHAARVAAELGSVLSRLWHNPRPSPKCDTSRNAGA